MVNLYKLYSMAKRKTTNNVKELRQSNLKANTHTHNVKPINQGLHFFSAVQIDFVNESERGHPCSIKTAGSILLLKGPLPNGSERFVYEKRINKASHSLESKI